MKVYQLSKWYVFSLRIVYPLIVVLFFLNFLINIPLPGLMKWGWLITATGLACSWYFILGRVAFEIKIQDDNSLEFLSALGKTVILPEDIKSIKSQAIPRGIYVKHTKGKIGLVLKMPGLQELISTVKTLNPAIEINVKGF